MKFNCLWAFATALFTLIGCSGSSGPLTSASGLVNELGSGGLEGVQVCPVGSSPDECVLTNENGIYTLSQLESETDLSLTVSKSGYIGGALSFTTGLEPIEVPVVSMAGEVVMQLQNGILDVETIENTGQIAFSISNGINGDGLNVPNIKTQLEPASGSGPFYANDNGLPNVDLTETSGNGGGVYVNVSPGIYSLTFLNIPPNCTPMLGWGPVGNPSFEVFANRVTYVRIECANDDSA